MLAQVGREIPRGADIPLSQTCALQNINGKHGKNRGGGGGIRTPETLTGLTVFKTAGFNRSPTPPEFRLQVTTSMVKTTDLRRAQMLEACAETPRYAEGEVDDAEEAFAGQSAGGNSTPQKRGAGVRNSTPMRCPRSALPPM